MTKPKVIAKTLTGILDNPMMEIVRNRRSGLDMMIPTVQEWWGYDLFNRKPGPAYIDDQFVGTDLDLSCLLFELSERHAVINIPEYQPVRPKTIQKGYTVLSTQNRHGEIIGLISNKDSFLFSLRIKDLNTMVRRKDPYKGVTKISKGAYKNFSLTNLNGELHDYCKCLQFVPTSTENKFLVENKVLSANNNIFFEYFVHPNRWSSMFGHHYVVTKMLIERLKEECVYYQTVIDDMRKKGVRYPKKGGYHFGWPEKTHGPGKKVKIEVFQVEMEFPKHTSTFPSYLYTQDNLVKLTEKRNYWQYTLIPKLQFAVRTVELAYYKYGNNRIPHWIKNTKWESNFRVPGGRIKWDRIILFQNKVGELGISLKKRVYQKTEDVALSY